MPPTLHTSIAHAADAAAAGWAPGRHNAGPDDLSFRAADGRSEALPGPGRSCPVQRPDPPHWEHSHTAARAITAAAAAAAAGSAARGPVEDLRPFCSSVPSSVCEEGKGREGKGGEWRGGGSRRMMSVRVRACVRECQ